MLGLGIQFWNALLKKWEWCPALYGLKQPLLTHFLFCLFLQVFPQFYQQYETYPFWPFIPQDVQHITPEYVLNTAKPIAPKTAEETKVWW